MLTLNSRPYWKPLKGDTSIPDGYAVPQMVTYTVRHRAAFRGSDQVGC